MHNRPLLGTLLGLLFATGCTGADPSATSDNRPLEDSDPLSLVWVAPSAASAVRTDAPLDLAVSTQNPSAAVIHFALDGNEVAVCDPSAPGEDCHRGSLYLWTTWVRAAGHHVASASFTDASGATVRATREFDAVDPGSTTSDTAPPSASPTEADPIAPDALDLGSDGTIHDPNAPPATEPDAPVVTDDESSTDPPLPEGAEDDGTIDPTLSTAPPVGQLADYLTDRGYLDPSSAFHSASPGGLEWQVVGQRVMLRGEVVQGDIVDVADCVAVYGDSIARQADLRYVSRASLTAAAVAATGCQDGGANWGPAGIRRSTCAALTAGDPTPLDPVACGQRMRDSADFAFDIAARWISSAPLRGLHHNDPPLVAATYATGGLYPSRSNPWRLAVPNDYTGTRDFITSFVGAYNAYRTMEDVNAETDRDHAIDQGSPIFSSATPMMDDGVVSEATIDADSMPDDPTAYASTGTGLDAPIHYHGGPVMTGAAINVYFVWYGSRWNAHPSTSRVLRRLIADMSDSAYWHINLTYPDAHGNRPSRVLRVGGQVRVGIPNHAASYTISDQNIANTIARQIQTGHLPNDPNGIYLLMGASNVTAHGFCTKFCGWHSWMGLGSSRYVYGFIGNTARCPNRCAAQRRGPSGDYVGDAMASVVAHETSESATDPQLDAWHDNTTNRWEDADKCVWTFGHYAHTSNGARTNLSLHGHHYYIQRNWVNRSGGYCAMRVQ